MRGGRVGVVATLCCLLLSAAGTAHADPGQSSTQEVYAALQVARQPSDYVVIVDTSGSMKIDNRYARVKSAVHRLLNALRPDDHVSLVTFDNRAAVRFRGAIGKDPLAALRSLPNSPRGKLTDIGAGISAGIAELEAPAAKPVGAIVLITDGKLDTDPKSPYRKTGSAAWAALRDRAATVAAGHQVASYALALGKGADAGLLRQVFPQAEDIPAAKIDDRFAELDAAVLRFQATEVLRSDLAHGVTATFADELKTLPTSGHATTAVTLTSSYEHVPVVVSGLGVSASGLPQLQATTAATEIVLDPGKSVQVPITLDYTGTGTGMIRVTGTVSSPWSDVITKDLGLAFAPRLVAERPVEISPVSGATSPGAPFPMILLVAAGLAALAMVLLLGWLVAMMVRPAMVGSLTISRPDGSQDEVLLKGRRATVTLGALGGQTVGATRKASNGTREPGVKLRLRNGAQRVRTALFDGDTTRVADLTVGYTSARTRMLDLIGTEGGA